MLRVGLTGGLATGKTFVGKALEELGCRLLSADELGRQALEPGRPGHHQAVEAFGPDILDGDGQIDRRKLGSVVFGDPGKLSILNSIVHPAVIAAEEQWIRRVEGEDPHSIAVVEAAILIETGSYKRFEKLILTVCGEEQQIARAIKRDGLTRDEVLDRLKRQMPINEKRKYADYVIDTSGDKDLTLAQVRQIYGGLRSLTV
ncbi:dephospho-CoA kinase [uncultured Paludibaculum sp.]|uniref:dephospho-CoA kinase n=1 Tax=uncultured Paludibaculum sp. TaxID=1765020 RepID=UPI002AAB678A|nr:dephospho-CoA kinase [uncultured Paludibaculum sp.]